jgi:hypothetical protein
VAVALVVFEYHRLGNERQVVVDATRRRSGCAVDLNAVLLLFVYSSSSSTSSSLLLYSNPSIIFAG